jgi:hypothetical protein
MLTTSKKTLLLLLFVDQSFVHLFSVSLSLSSVITHSTLFYFHCFKQFIYLKKYKKNSSNIIQLLQAKMKSFSLMNSVVYHSFLLYSLDVKYQLVVYCSDCYLLLHSSYEQLNVVLSSHYYWYLLVMNYYVVDVIAVVVMIFRRLIVYAH